MKNQNEMILMQDLSMNEMKEANGGFFVVIAGVAAGVAAAYTIYRAFRR